jgi:hypothetical protein
MVMPGFSAAEIALWRRGPIPNRVDLWLEIPNYYQSFHEQFIGTLVEQLADPLLAMGYVAGRETSLQVTERREPDLYLLQRPLRPFKRWDYVLAARSLLAEPGVAAIEEAELSALAISDGRSGDLVTIVEIVSPGNKDRDTLIVDYQERRQRLFLERGINVVEIDLTRSVKRLTNNRYSAQSPYHIAVHLPTQPPRIISIGLDTPLPRIALPLRSEAIALEVSAAYARTYEKLLLAYHIDYGTGYREEHLPFPSLLTDTERARALQAVAEWKAELKQVQDSSTSC